MLAKTSASAFTKFIVVGILSTAINYGVFYLLYKNAGYSYIIASVTGYICGLLAGMMLNNFWTFNRNKMAATIVLQYCMVYLLSLGLGTGFLWICVHLLHFNPLISNFFTIGLTTLTNFALLNFVVYKNEKPQA